MPARIRNSQRLTSSLSSQLSSSSQYSPSLLSYASVTSSTFLNSSRSFSSTPTKHATKLRRDMIQWLNTNGTAFKHPLPGSTNYLSAYNRAGKLRREKDMGEDGVLPPETKDDMRPFPLNKEFVSEPVLSEELRNHIYKQVVEKGDSVRTVSVLYNIDMRRVAAVVRLVELEKQMVKENKPLALPYARAVHQMLPTTPLVDRSRSIPKRHEHINELPVHRLTDPQIFYPVSESRQFNRVDAGRVFSAAPALRASQRDKPSNTPEAIAKITQHPGKIERIGKGDNVEQVLQPADVRIPHPHLVAFEYDNFTQSGEQGFRGRRLRRGIDAEDEAAADRKERRKKKIEAATARVAPEGSRFEFRVRDAVVSRETTGMTGRGTKAPGARYGVPNSERKRGAIKIPKRVIA